MDSSQSDKNLPLTPSRSEGELPPPRGMAGEGFGSHSGAMRVGWLVSMVVVIITVAWSINEALVTDPQLRVDLYQILVNGLVMAAGGGASAYGMGYGMSRLGSWAGSRFGRRLP